MRKELRDVVGKQAGWVWWRWRGAQGEVGRCAKCGYEVKGLPTLHCPECGSDLRAGSLTGAAVLVP